MSSNGPDGTTLVVPVNVVALCVGERDAQTRTNHFAGATADFTQQTTDARDAFLGDNVARSFSDPPLEQLDQGIHLHWALPDALTHADVASGTLSFPAAPNRWLVTRLVLDGTTPTSRSWLIESDAVAPEKPDRPTVAVATSASGNGQDYGWLGRVLELDDDWSVDSVPPLPSLRETTGTDLSAVTNGQVSFAAYYPSCLSAFGFWDDLDDLHGPAQLAYTVIGWFSDPAADPVQPGATAASLQAARGWTLAPGASPPTGSVYSGTVQGIAWDSLRDYVSEKPVPAELAIGNDPAEALAAYFAKQEQPGVKLFEQLLVALQLGLFDGFANAPKPDQLAELYERLHDSRFARAAVQVITSIVAAGGAGPGSQLLRLPPALATQLNQLNLLEQRRDLVADVLDWLRWYLFADWYRIFEATDDDDRNAAVNAVGAKVDAAGPLQQASATAAAAASAQLAVVLTRLGLDLETLPTPSEPYVQPNDPALLITGDQLVFPERYGGDGRFNHDGWLVCRTGDQIIAAATVHAKALTAAAFDKVAAPPGVPGAALFTSLLREACLLDSALGSALTGADAGTLQTALRAALVAGQQSEYAFETGSATPSPVAIEWWAANDWLPLFVTWTAEWLPIRADREYPPAWFTANFKVDQNAGGAIGYAPDGSGASVTVHPATQPFTHKVTGDAHLTPTAAATLGRVLGDEIDRHPDPQLRDILALLGRHPFLTAPLTGFTDLLRMRRQSLQLTVAAADGSPYKPLTDDQVRPIVGDKVSTGPDLDPTHDPLRFMPLRAGYLKVELEVVDAYGQRRRVDVGDTVVAESLAATDGGKPVPSVAYLEPRLAQPSRLLFRWVAADGTGLEEMTPRPAAPPMCGWLVPNHLDGSLFLFTGAGRALGTLYPAEEGIGWQTAPGDDATIGDDVATVLAHENPQLRDLVLALAGSSLAFFRAFWAAIDNANANVNPGPLSTNAGLAPLVGRPVALAQADLRVELQGRPALDLSWDLVGVDTADGVTGVDLPIVLGNLERLGDGLVGYFLPDADRNYVFSTMYSPGADKDAKSGVVRPGPDTVTVTPAPRLDEERQAEGDDPTLPAPGTLRVLLLVDPQAPVHATSGVLPTATLEIPPDQANDVIASLDFSFLSAPVLDGAGGLAMPTPQVPGYELSWVEEGRTSAGVLEWVVDAEVLSPVGRAVWGYTPQQLAEGWMRINPHLLDFSLADAAGEPVVRTGGPNDLTLTITSLGQRPITFNGGAPVPEGSKPTGSVVYLHFGTLTDAAGVAAMQLSAPGWTFALFTTPEYGTYWGGAPAQSVTLGHGDQIVVALVGVTPTTTAANADVTFDYAHIDGLNDGVSVDTLTIQKGTP